MKTWGAEKYLEWLLFLTGNKKKKRYLKGKKKFHVLMVYGWLKIQLFCVCMLFKSSGSILVSNLLIPFFFAPNFFWQKFLRYTIHTH